MRAIRLIASLRFLTRLLLLAALPLPLLAQLQVTTTSLPSGALGFPYSQPLAANGGSAPYSWSVTAGQLPFGLALSAGGVISGTPQLAKPFSFTVQVRDGVSATASKALSITVAQQLMIVNPQLDTGILGKSISTQLTAANGTPAYTFSLVSGPLPPGYTFTAAGLLSGTPTQSGSWPLTFQVNDSAAGSAQRAYMLQVTTTPAIPAWRTRGLYGGTISLIAVSPAWLTDRTLFTAGADGVLFRSSDAGATWNRTTVHPPYPDQTITALALSPQYDQLGATALNSTLFASTVNAGILKSTNHGASFSQANTGLPCDGANPCNNGAYPYAAVRAVAISPNYAADQTLWAVTGTNFAVHSAVYRSTNGGASWVAGLDLGVGNFGQVAITASSAIATDHTVFFYLDDKLYRSTNNGLNWTLVFTDPISGPLFTHLAVSPAYSIDQTVMLVDGAHHLFRSQDGGTTFAQLTTSVIGLTAVNRPGQAPYWFSLTGGGAGYQFFRSENYGDTFNQLLGSALPPYNFSNQAIAAGPVGAGGEPDLFAGNLRGLFTSTDGGLSVAERDRGIANVEFPRDLGADVALSGAGLTLAGGGRDGWVKSVDGGLTWVRSLTGDIVSFNALSPDYPNDHVMFRGVRSGCSIKRITDDGPVGVTVLTFPCAPFNLPLSYGFEPGFSGGSGVMYIGTTAGLYRGTGGGQSFAPVVLPAACGGTTSPPPVYSVAVSPNFAADATMFVSTDNATCKSVNGGATWSALTYGGQPIYGPLAVSPVYNNGGANGSAAKIVISLAYPAGATHKPLRSTNGGATWSLIPSLGDTSAGDQRYFTRFSPNFATDRTVFIAGSDDYFGLGIWRSTDSGATFSKLAAPDQLLSRRVTGLYLLPGFNGGNTTSNAIAVTEASGVWRSTDSGVSFAPVPDYSFISGALRALARAADGTLFAATGDQGIFRSVDDGVTFANISTGLPPGADCRAVAVPSASPSTPVAGCAGSGLWKYNGASWAQIGGFTAGTYVSFLEDNLYFYANRADGVSLRGAKDATGFTAQQAAQGDLMGSDYNPSTNPTLLATNRSGAPAAVTASLWAVSRTGGARYSTDYGASWIPAPGGGDYTLPGGANYATVGVLGVNPVSGGREVLAGSDSALHLTRDGGVTWRSVSGPGSGLEGSSRNFSATLTATTPSGGTDILMGVTGSITGGVYLSGDGGEHWTQLNQGFDPSSLNISTLVKTSCSGCPVQYYSGTYGSGVYTRTIAVNNPPAVTGWYFGSTTLGCGTAISCATGGAACGPEPGGQPFKLCGSGFQASPVVEFDGVPAAGCSAVSGSVITCTGTPAHIPGSAVVRVRNTDTRSGLMTSAYTYQAGAPRVVNSLRVAKAGGDANLTWSCAGCTASAPARVTRSQNAPFTLNLEPYNGGASGGWTNSGALAPGANPSYFWTIE